MAKEKKTEGFHSAAGLIRYFEAEDEKSFKIDPRIVLGMAVGIIVLLELVRYFYKY